MNREFTRAPHRMPEAAPVETAALLIDFDNVTMGIRSNLGQELRRLLDSDIIRGKVAVQRAYADWRRYPQYIVPLSEASIDLIFAPAYGSSKKNATDIRMAIDGLELVFTRPEIGTFILLTGDSDFSSLVLKLKEYGKYVIGVGLQESASDILVQNCDEYYSYNQVSGLVSADDMKTESHDPWVLVSKAIRRMAERGDVMRSDRLKQVMLEIDQTFDEKSAGFSKFNRFLAEATHKNLIEMRKGQNGQYEVGLGSEIMDDGGMTSVDAAPAPSAKAPSSGRSRRGGRGGRSKSESGRPAAKSGGRGGSERRGGPAEAPAPRKKASGTSLALDEAYEALAAVVDDLYDGSSAVRDSMAKRKLIARDSGFDEGGLGFPKFSLFLKQAAEDEAIILEQRQDGNFYLLPAKGGKKGRPAPRRDTEPRTAEKESAAASEDRPKRGLLGRLLGGGRQKPAAEEPTKPAPREREAPATPKAERSEASRPAGGQRGQQGRGRGGERGGGGRGGQQSRSPGPDQEKRGREAGQRGGRAPEDKGGQKARGGQGSRSRDAERSKAPDRKQGSARSEGSRSRDRDRQKPRQGRRDDAGRARSDDRDARAGDDRKAREARTSEPKAKQAPPAEPVKSEPDAGPEPRRLGRYRSGSRGRSPAKPAGSASTGRIGPLPREGDEADGEKKPPKTSSDRPAADESREPPKRSVRGRGGAKSPSQGSARTGASSPAAEAKPEAGKSAGASPEASPEAVDHMVRNYAGVGKRTAEVLVEHFGAQVFEVIDSQPGRLTEVLSDGRARAVIAAREQEREG
ncbi:MAG: NYN domain-containing protein [Gemmatimonadota bacterium]|nr:NYN domain-containing protein [Gemmatimonadota bacterium]